MGQSLQRQAIKNIHRERPSFKQQLGEGGKRQVKKQKKEAYPSQPPAYEGKGKPDQLPKRKQWCRICWKKGHRTQVCWWANQQHQQQHQQHLIWCNPSKQQHTTAEAFKKRSHTSTDQPVTTNSLTLANQLASSLEHEPSVATKAPVNTIAMLESGQHASSTTKAWGILADTGAATSIASPQSFASDIELSPAPSTFQLITATGRVVQTDGLRKAIFRVNV